MYEYQTQVWRQWYRGKKTGKRNKQKGRDTETERMSNKDRERSKKRRIKESIFFLYSLLPFTLLEFCLFKIFTIDDRIKLLL